MIWSIAEIIAERGKPPAPLVKRFLAGERLSLSELHDARQEASEIGDAAIIPAIDRSIVALGGDPPTSNTHPATSKDRWWRRLLRRSIMEDKNKDNGKADVMFHCDRCGADVPWTGSHVCGDRLSPKVKAGLERERKERAARKAEELRPRPCPDCGEMVVPGQQHWCSLVPKHDPLANITPDPIPGEVRRLLPEIIKQLRAAGYDLVKRDEAAAPKEPASK